MVVVLERKEEVVIDDGGVGIHVIREWWNERE